MKRNEMRTGRWLILACVLMMVMALWMTCNTAFADCDYHVIYTYGSKEYQVDPGDTVTKVSDVLQALELPGVVTSVTSFDNNSLSVTAVENDWSLQALSSFGSSGTFTCTVAGEEKTIRVASLPNSISVALYRAMNFDPSGGTGEYKTTYNNKEYTNHSHSVI